MAQTKQYNLESLNLPTGIYTITVRSKADEYQTSPPSNAVTYIIQSQGLVYGLSDDSSYYICGGIGTATDTDIIIASEIDGIPVKSIGNSAFEDCDSLTSITIPDSVTSIGASAFSGCSSLESITLPFVGDSEKTSSDTYQYPFGYIFGTDSYTGGVETKQYYHGSSTSSTTSSTYYIPASLKTVTVTGGNILYGAFYNCKSLTSITIPDGVTSIGERAFLSCRSLTSITIPDGVTSIGYQAFYYCNSLTSITIPNSVTSIGNYAFEYCSSLTSINIPDGVTSIRIAVFSNCTSLTSITIPNGVTSISDSAFYNCSNLMSINISNSVTSIDNRAFYNCSSLTSITFTENSQLTSIGEYAFYGCKALETVYYTGTEEQWNTITINKGNDPLSNATIVYNYNPTPGEPDPSN